LSQEVVSLSDRSNILLNRREVTVLFREQAGKLGRSEAAEVVAKKFGLNKNCVMPMKMKSERGKKDVIGTFYAFDTEGEIKNHLPRYRLLRNLSKEERKKKIDEEKAAKIKAKQAASSETKGSGKGR
jgi:small subunit ribosomal protein S24e